MTEPIDDRTGGEWAPPRPVDDPPTVEVHPADGPLPGSPVGLGGSPAGFGSPAALPGSPVAVPGSGSGLAVPPTDAVPVRITLPPEMRPAWAHPTGPPAAGPAPWAPPVGRPAWPAPPAAPGWSGAPGWPGGPDPRGAPAGHPLSNPNWSPAGRPANPGWPAATLPRSPSGLFPSGPPRPTYREPHPVRGAAVAIGAGAGALWMLLFGLVASSVRGYAWWTISAGIAAWLAALVLARFGDRGVAVGVAASAGLGAAIAGSVVFAQFVGGHWVLW